LDERIEKRNTDGTTELMCHATWGSITRVKNLIAAGADVNATNAQGRTALEYAIGRGVESASAIIDVLLDAKADGGKALEVAAWAGQAAVITQLLARGVDANAVGSDGFTALRRSAYQGYLDIAKQLLAARATVHGRNNDGRTALILASGVKEGKREMVRLLLDHKADINERWGPGRTALMTAVVCEKADVVEELIASKADLNARDSRGSTALSKALSAGIIQQLKDAGGSA
jgi:ankyrin repeat protein